MSAQSFSSEEQIKKNMDDMYRWTRHVYDISRKYYLLGRDSLIENLNAKNGELVCEVGCGTARNLTKMAKRYPSAKFCGLDASEEMLKTAAGNLERASMSGKVNIKQAYSQSFDPKTLFEIERPLDKIVFSYALSIIPPWQESVDHALELLASGGQIHIVDFGGQDDLPPVVRKVIFWFLSKFHVYHKPEVLEYLKQMADDKKGSIEVHNLYRGYTYRVIFTKI